jgi:hypothetical protein
MIPAIQEARGQGHEICDYDEYTVYYNGTKEENVFGTGFLVHRKFKNHIKF